MGEGAADDGVGDEFNAHGPQRVELGVDDAVWQTELGDAVFENAADFVKGLEDGDVEAAAGHLTGERESGGA